jgi:chemotaxis protein MotB
MRNGLIFSFFALLLFLGCAKTVPVEQYNVKAKEADALLVQNDNLQGQVKSLTADVASLKKEQEMTRMEKEALQAKVDELSQKAEKAEQLEKATQTYQDLQKKLEKEIQEGQVQIKEMKDRLTVTMVDQILFPSGSAEVGKKGKAVLDKVVTILKDVKDKRIEVDGHTDNVPIVSSLKKRFPTNWELSTARATEVVRYLQETGGIDPRLLSATGFAAYMPVAPNDTEEGKHKNRRIEIVLLPLLK